MNPIGEFIPDLREPQTVEDLTFERFWAEYPRKTGDKQKARQKFGELSAADRKLAIDGAIRHREGNPQWQDQSLIPHPTTYINQRRWENEFTARPRDEVIQNGHKSPTDLAWSALYQMFGQRLIDSYGKTPPAVWRGQLDKLEPELIARGLAQVRDQGLNHPPSLPQFIAFCRIGNTGLPEARMLPKAPRNEKLAYESIEEAKRILGIK